MSKKWIVSSPAGEDPMGEELMTQREFHSWLCAVGFAIEEVYHNGVDGTVTVHGPKGEEVSLNRGRRPIVKA